MPALFQSSGDLIADRRYAFGRDLMERGDVAAAADLFAQAAETAPQFTAAWFALGEARAKIGETSPARAAFARVLTLDPGDRYGARLHLGRLDGTAVKDIPPDYVRAVFDQYAPRFEDALTRGLGYRGPELLLTATQSACKTLNRDFHFGSVLDLGCGTGLGGAAFRPFADHLAGTDISSGMVRIARANGNYDRLEAAEIVEYLTRERAANASHHLVLAADVFPYFGDADALIRACANVMAPQALLAFTAETHAGDGIQLGNSLRYGHAATYLQSTLGNAGLRTLVLKNASARNEAGVPVPGLVVVAMK